MSVPTWRRNKSKTQFIYNCFVLNQEVARIMTKVPKKYRTNYCDEIIKECMEALFQQKGVKTTSGLVCTLTLHTDDSQLCTSEIKNMVDFTSYRELLEAGKKCCNGYRWKQSVQMFEMHTLRWTAKNRRELIDFEWKPMNTHDFVIKERGKDRQIKAHHIRDRQVYKSYNKNVLKPSFENLWVETNSASQDNKGTDYAIKRFRQDLSHAYKKCGTDFYVVTYDFHNYFYSIDHEIMKDDLLDHIIDRPDIFNDYLKVFATDVGIGIGGEPSQTIAITYPHKLDKHLECSPLVLRSGRFMDDGYAICRTKKDAQKILDEVYEYSYMLNLEINPKHTRISYMKTDSIIFLKKRTRITKTGKIIMRLTRENVKSELKRIDYQSRSKIQPMESIIQSFKAWSSYALKYGAYYQVVKVSHYFSTIFNIQYKEVKELWTKKF